MASQGWPLVFEVAPMALQLAGALDHDALIAAAKDEEAAARWGDRVMQDKFLAGDEAAALREKKKNDKSRARARHYRKLAEQMQLKGRGIQWTVKD